MFGTALVADVVVWIGIPVDQKRHGGELASELDAHQGPARGVCLPLSTVYAAAFVICLVACIARCARPSPTCSPCSCGLAERP